MKQYKNLKSAMLDATNLLKKSEKNFIGVVAEQVYKDSNEFTYRQSGEMYKSGELHNKLQEGIIIERTPYVRRRYYEGGVPGGKNTTIIENKKPTYNPKAQPRWFEKTISKNKEKYKKVYGHAVEEAKGR